MLENKTLCNIMQAITCNTSKIVEIQDISARDETSHTSQIKLFKQKHETTLWLAAMHAKFSKNILPNENILYNPEHYFRYLAPSEKTVLKYIATYCFTNDAVYPSHEYIAQQCGLSAVHVQRVLAKFHKDGIIPNMFRQNNTSIYYLSSWIRSYAILTLLKKYIPTLCVSFLFFILSSPAINNNQIETDRYNTRFNSYSYLSILENNNPEGTYNKKRTYEECYYLMHEAEITTTEGTLLAEGTNVEKGLRSNELHPSNLAWWDQVSDTMRVPSAKVRYDEVIFKKNKEKTMNPIKVSVIEANDVLNLNKVGQALLMKYSDTTLKYATSIFKKLKEKKDRPFEYFIGICNNHSTKNRLEMDQQVVADIMQEYNLDYGMQPTGLLDTIGRFEGEPVRTTETRQLTNHKQSVSPRQAVEQPSEPVCYIKKDENSLALEFLENYMHNPDFKCSSLRIQDKELLAKAIKLQADGIISPRPISIWIESIKPDKSDYNMSSLMGKETYQQKMRRWMEMHSKIVDDKKIMTFENGWEIEQRDIIIDEQPRQTLSSRVQDMASLLGSLFKQGSTSIIKEVLNPDDINDHKKDNHSSLGNSIFQNDDERILPAHELAIPIVTHAMLKTMNLEKERITPVADILETTVDTMSTVEYIDNIAQYFYLEEVYD